MFSSIELQLALTHNSRVPLPSWEDSHAYHIHTDTHAYA